VAQSRQKKLTPTQIKKQTQKIQEVIDKHKRENREDHFTSLTATLSASTTQIRQGPAICMCMSGSGQATSIPPSARFCSTSTNDFLT
jgi:hypothetical protein